MPSKAHRILVKNAKNELLDKGYEVFEEYHVKIFNKECRVDVVGIKGTYKVAIECGKTKISKIRLLKKLFDEVRRFNYTMKVNPKRSSKMKFVPTLTNIFGRGKTTVPSDVRKLLELKDGNKILWVVDSSNRVYIESAKRRDIRYPSSRRT